MRARKPVKAQRHSAVRNAVATGMQTKPHRLAAAAIGPGSAPERPAPGDFIGPRTAQVCRALNRQPLEDIALVPVAYAASFQRHRPVRIAVQVNELARTARTFCGDGTVRPRCTGCRERTAQPTGHGVDTGKFHLRIEAEISGHRPAGGKARDYSLFRHDRKPFRDIRQHPLDKANVVAFAARIGAFRPRRPAVDRTAAKIEQRPVGSDHEITG